MLQPGGEHKARSDNYVHHRVATDCKGSDCASMTRVEEVEPEILAAIEDRNRGDIELYKFAARVRIVRAKQWVPPHFYQPPVCDYRRWQLDSGCWWIGSVGDASSTATGDLIDS